MSRADFLLSYLTQHPTHKQWQNASANKAGPSNSSDQETQRTRAESTAKLALLQAGCTADKLLPRVSKGDSAKPRLHSVGILTRFIYIEAIWGAKETCNDDNTDDGSVTARCVMAIPDGCDYIGGPPPCSKDKSAALLRLIQHHPTWPKQIVLRMCRMPHSCAFCRILPRSD